MSIPKPGSPAVVKKFAEKNNATKKAKDAKPKLLNYDVILATGHKIVVQGTDDIAVMDAVFKKYGGRPRHLKKQAYKPKKNLTHRPFEKLNSALYGKGSK